MNNNYYFGHIKEIIAIAQAHNADWGEAVDRFDQAHGAPGDVEAQRAAFFEFVRGKAFEKDGTYRYVWKDGSLHDTPEEVK